MATPRLISLFEIFATQQTFQFCDWYDDSLPTFQQKLTEPLTLSKELADITFGILPQRSATARLSDINTALYAGGDQYGVNPDGTDSGYGDWPYGGVGVPTIAEIIAAEDLRGKRARARVRDVDAAVDIFTIEGTIQSARLGALDAEIEITSGDLEAFDEQVPKRRILDVYPNASLVNIRDPQAPIFVPFGVARKVSLSLVRSVDGVSYDYGVFRKPATGSLVLNTIYRDGRVVDYPNLLTNPGFETGTFTGWTTLGTPGGGESSTVDSAIKNSGTYSFKLVANAGSGHGKEQTITVTPGLVYRLSAWVNVTVRTAGWLNIDVQGTGIDTSGIQLLSVTTGWTYFEEYVTIPAGTTSIKVRVHSEPSSVLTAYIDDVSFRRSEYQPVESPTGNLLVRFVRAQTDVNGRAMTIQADVTVTEFTNPANAIKFVLEDATYGLGKTVNAASFVTAASDYTTLGISVASGLFQRVRAFDVLNLLLLHGATLDKNSAGEYTIQVDTLALHATATISLGAEDRYYNNVNLESVEVVSVPLQDQPRQIIVQGLWDPGFPVNGSQGAWLLTGTRSVAGKGKEVTLQNQFLGDTTSLDKQGYYLAERLKRVTRGVRGDAQLAAKALNLGELVSFNAPALSVNETLEVRGLGFRGSIDENGNIEAWITFVLGQYSSAIFSYVASVIQAASTAGSLTDYSLTPPDPPTNFLNDTPITFVNTNGVVESRIRVHADAPTVNVSALLFRVLKAGAAIAVGERYRPATPGATNVTTDLTVEPGLLYDLECYAYQTTNVAGFQLGTAAILTNVSVPDDSDIPTNLPVPTSLSKAINNDGSMDVTLQWNPYAQGAKPADLLILFWKSGTAPLSTPAGTDKGLHLNIGVTTYTFHGLNPDTNYRFGIAAARKPKAGGYAVGAIQAPTAAPDWADISDISTITGVPATTVVANAADGKTAFDGTVVFRSNLAPTNNPVPQSFASVVNLDGSADYSLGWDYTQGALPTSGYVFFWFEGNGTPTEARAHYTLKNTAAPILFTLRGLPSDRLFSFGVAAYRETADGVKHLGAIQSSTAAPDWQGISSGSPNYGGTIFGLEQHNFQVRADGNSIPNRVAEVWKDGVLINTGGRSYNLSLYNLTTKAFLSHTAYDLFAQLLAATEYGTNGGFESDFSGWSDLGTAGGGDARTIDSGTKFEGDKAFKLVCASGTTLGKTRVVTVDTAADNYIICGWMKCTARVAGLINIDVTGTGLDTGGITLTQVTTHWVYFSEAFAKPAGTTSLTIRCFADSSPNLTVFFDEVRLYLSQLSSVLADDMNKQAGLSVTDKRALILYTRDAPEVHRLEGGLPEAIRRHGGTRVIFNSTAFKTRSAYVLVGLPLIGEGNGVERYAGANDEDSQAQVIITFQTQGDQIVNVKGTGYQPWLIPGVPTNNPTPSALAQVATDTGHRADKLSWTYTQPAMTGDNRLADGFILYYESGNTSNPTGNEIKLGVDVRDYTFHWSHDQTVSYAIAAYRVSANRMEVGAKQTSAASPDWQGVSSAGLIGTPGIGPGVVTNPKRSDTTFQFAVSSSVNANTGSNPVTINSTTLTFTISPDLAQVPIAEPFNGASSWVATLNDISISQCILNLVNLSAISSAIQGNVRYW